MTREELCKLVLLEANNIKKSCTAEEILKLDINLLCPLDEFRCIYGQMTGSCHNRRTTELVKDLPVYFENVFDYYQVGDITVNETLKREVNFSVNLSTMLKEVFSPIEVYISLPESDNENLINYIKGTSKELNIN